VTSSTAGAPRYREPPSRADTDRPGLGPGPAYAPAVPPFRHTHDDATVWLSPLDARVGVAVVRATGEAVLEIGVYRGGWSRAVLWNVPGARVIGIDPYPWNGGAETRVAALRTLAQAGVADRFTLHASWDELAVATPDGRFDVVHVDGAHDEASVVADLDRAAAVLASGGALVVDDIRHLEYPGLVGALHRFLVKSDFRVVATTPQKAVVARAGDTPALQAALTPLLDDLGVAWRTRPFQPDVPYTADELPATVLGCPVLLVNGPVADGIAGLAPTRAGQRTPAWRRLAHDVCPPVLARAVRRVRRR